MIYITQTHVWMAFLATCFLMMFHFASPKIMEKYPMQSETFASFAGGTAVAYVFLHMLPDLVEYNEPIGEFLADVKWLTPLTELMIYILALVGFLIYLGLELLAEQSSDNKASRVYQLHLLMFCLYNFLITYTMSLRVQMSMMATVLFTLSMAFHFILTDKKFCKLYPKQFSYAGRYILIVALLLGWLVSVFFDPVNVVVIACMLAFLSGSVLQNVFREELPKTNLLHFGWFCLGSFSISLVLLFSLFY